MPQKSESRQHVADLIKQDRSAWEWACRVETLLFDDSEVERRFRIAVELKSYKESVTLKLAEEAEQEGREQQALSTSEGIRRGDGLLTAAAWLREKAR